MGPKIDVMERVKKFLLLGASKQGLDVDFNHYLLSDAGLSILQQYFNQILTAVLEVLDDSDSSTRELALSLIAEMLNNQV
jgi:hypothetical protein